MSDVALNRPWWLRQGLAESTATAPPAVTENLEDLLPLAEEPTVIDLTDDLLGAAETPPPVPPTRGGGDDGRNGTKPRDVAPAPPLADRIFGTSSRAVASLVLLITGSIAIFLAQKAFPTFHHYGLSFLTTASWNPASDKVGIAAVLVGTATVGLLAMLWAFPLALATALFISEYAPAKLRSSLVSAIDLMAAIPSIVYGLWGFFLIQQHAARIALFVSRYFGWIPIFHVTGGANGPDWDTLKANFTASAFIASLPVAMMVLPMACAVMREVFSQTPPGEKEAALALGATRWAMIRSVVIPFSRGGIIGGTMLALGRALGETIAVYLIVSPAFVIKFRPLELGTNTISSLIAGRFGEANSEQLAALLTAGFVLFLITLLVNTVAAIIVNRGRNAGSDI